MARNIDQMITEQVRAWTLQESERERGGLRKSAWPIITISREFGAQGSALAAMLGRSTGFKVWDRDLVQAIAERSGGEEHIVRTLDEHRRKAVEEAVRSVLSSGPHTNTQYFMTLMRVVHTIAAHGRAIVVGRGANHIIADPAILRVRVVCPLRQRIAGYAGRRHVPLGEAKRIVKERDQERDDFIRFHFKQDINVPTIYDLVVNTGTMDVEDLVDLVREAYRLKVGRSLPRIK